MINVKITVKAVNGKGLEKDSNDGNKQMRRYECTMKYIFSKATLTALQKCILSRTYIFLFEPYDEENN